MQKTIVQNRKRSLLRRAYIAALGVVAATPAFAQSTPPLDMTSTGTTIAGYVAVAAAAGLGVFAAIHGVRVIVKSFRTVGK